MDNQIKFPIILVSTNNSLEIITNSNQITHITNLALKDRTLIGAIIFDSNEAIYQIKDVLKIGNLNPWWKFDFLNPIIQIKLVTEYTSITFLEAKERIINGIKFYPDFWNSHDLQEIIDTIEGRGTMSEIINYLKGIRGIR